MTASKKSGLAQTELIGWVPYAVSSLWYRALKVDYRRCPHLTRKIFRLLGKAFAGKTYKK
jgi:hypothetical protein